MIESSLPLWQLSGKARKGLEEGAINSSLCFRSSIIPDHTIVTSNFQYPLSYLSDESLNNLNLRKFEKSR